MPPNQSSVNEDKSLRVAIIGQSAFAVEVFERLTQHGHVIVGVFTIPDKGRREDPLAKVATENDVPVFKFKAWRRAGKPLPEVLQAYQSVNADLNVLPYCSQFIPMEVINYPRLRSICYHPSILPRHRGASSINWTLMCGDKEAGFSIFWADDGLDTGPLLLQEKCLVEEDDTVDTLYKRFLYPAGVTAMARAVDMVANDTAPMEVQTEKGATYDPMLNKPELQKIDWTKTGRELHNFIRGLDSVPGASCRLKLPGTAEFQDVFLFGSSMWRSAKPAGTEVEIEDATPGVIHEDGLLLSGADGVLINVKRVKVNGRMKLASGLDQISQQVQIEFTKDEKNVVESVRAVWESILNCDVEDDTDLFASGAGSMDVVRLVEEVKDLCSIELENEDVFMAPVFDEFCQVIILKSRGANSGEIQIEYRALEMNINKMDIKVPLQLFIDGKFVDAEDRKTQDVINPTDESVICKVQAAGTKDVDKAVAAAKKAFETGEWSKISARERGQLLYK
ncbi:aldehyde dehydrogenase-related [Holotrichia oblita]|uniref:Aldehyde dehydrogenase-related n=1 Tax=Holotrichia oblita TaxID=644536 RepID=A0ACB9SIR6_HOLOL|nr:aldehyde dehydrogenase-related [Holotrichia oblita]